MPHRSHRRHRINRIDRIWWPSRIRCLDRGDRLLWRYRPHRAGSHWLARCVFNLLPLCSHDHDKLGAACVLPHMCTMLAFGAQLIPPGSAGVPGPPGHSGIYLVAAFAYTNSTQVCAIPWPPWGKYSTVSNHGPCLCDPHCTQLSLTAWVDHNVDYEHAVQY